MMARLKNAEGRSVHTTRDVQPWRKAFLGREVYPPLLRYDSKLFADTGTREDGFRLYWEVPDHGDPLST